MVGVELAALSKMHAGDLTSGKESECYCKVVMAGGHRDRGATAQHAQGYATPLKASQS